MIPQPLEKSILGTIIYFDLFDFPLTAFEIHKYLFLPDNNYSLESILSAVERLAQNKSLETDQSFYFLPDRREIVSLRKEKYLLAESKIKKGRKFLWLIARIPFVKEIFVCNDLAYQNAPLESDIDLAIITTQGRIWTARFFSTLLMKLLRKRPSTKERKNKVCLSFYIAEDNVSLESAAYEDDIHFIYWLNQFLPIYEDTQNQSQPFSEQFFQANSWTRRYLPNFFPNNTNDRWRIKSWGIKKRLLEKILTGRFGNWVEKKLKKLQMKVLPEDIRKLANEDSKDVIISDKILKFHNKDNRMEIKRRWEERIL